MQEETTLKLNQNQLENYQLNLQLPFIIKPPIFRKSHRYQRDGHWNQKQRLKYSVFLTYFREILEQPLLKKRIRIYEMMSDMIITRNANQCRSHHQKMEKYRTTIPEIIASVSEKYQPTIYKEQSNKYMTLIKGLLDNKEKYKRNFDPNDNKHKHSKKQPSLTIIKPQQQNQQKIGCQEIEHQKSHVQEERNNQQQMECQQEKKELKKTAEQYSQPNQNGCQDEQGVPVMRVGEMKEQEENESDEKQEREEVMVQQNNQIFAIPVGFALDTQTRYCYEQQLLALQLKKQWHAQNADQFYNQWSNQINSIKYCDDNIKFFKQLLMNHQRPL